jgi:hypothetical protein
MTRIAWISFLLLAGCQFGYDLEFNDDEVISCAENPDCAAGELCRGLVSDDEACSADGYVRIEDGRSSSEPFAEPSLAFICYQNNRYFPFCVDDQLTVCDSDDGCNDTHTCGAPVAGGWLDCVVADTSTTCTSDSDCATGACYALFDVGEDSWQVQARCATAR